MRRNEADRETQLDFVAETLKRGVPTRDAVQLQRERFGLSLRQARSDVKYMLVELHGDGGAAASGGRAAEDLCLAHRRLQRSFRIAMDKGDLRTAFKAEKSLCRLLGVYPEARRPAEEHERQRAEDRREQDRQEMLAKLRRRLRQAERNGTAESPATAEARLAPPTNRAHRPDCPCWACNPKYQAQAEDERRELYPAWLARRQAAELAPLLARWHGQDEAESDDEFAVRVQREAHYDAELHEVCSAVNVRQPQSPEVEKRLALLTK
jgi:hypothetical protein